jgi:hypothetical protein
MDFWLTFIETTETIVLFFQNSKTIDLEDENREYFSGTQIETKLNYLSSPAIY